VYIVDSWTRHTIRAFNVTPESPHYGEEVTFFRFLFKIVFKGGFTFERLQFPLRLCFAGTVHRYQGQTLPSNGKLLLDLRYTTFVHSQLYVAFSRAQRSSQVLVLQSYPERYADANVYRELLDACPEPIQEYDSYSCSESSASVLGDEDQDFFVVLSDSLTYTGNEVATDPTYLDEEFSDEEIYD
jgi:hypothetical protein